MKNLLNIYDELLDKSNLYYIKNFYNVKIFWNHVSYTDSLVFNDPLFEYEKFKLDIDMIDIPEYLDIWNYQFVLSRGSGNTQWFF